MQREPRGAIADGDGSLPRHFSALLRELAVAPEIEIGAAWDRALAPGVVIARFELVREVGRGGFGVVYEARDRELGRTVAFKAVRLGDRPDLREERLFREAEAAARLSHPNIVTVFDVGRGAHGPYLILEFLRGQTLEQRLRRGPLPVDEALRVMVEVGKGVAHAHANGVVHRDLTPGNVFLCDDGQVKVLDLGMAQAFGRRRLDGGTPGYMAPEQRRGAPEDERTDVFAMGVILYRMLAAELPFGGRAEELPARPAPALDVPGAPALGELIARMLDLDPVKRPRDGGEVLALLLPWHDELRRTPSTGDLPPARRRRHVSRRSAALIVAGSGLALAAALVLAFGAAGGRVRGSPAFPPAATAVPSIAVLPFEDLSAEKDDGYFADGLTEELLNALARVDGLRVPGRTSSFYFKGKSPRLADVGRELNVRTVLEGSVRRIGKRVRVTAEVVGVDDGYRLWGQTYDRELSDIFAVQDEIARAVVGALDLKLLAGKAPGRAAPAPADPEVYAQFLIGRQQYYRYTLESMRLAVEAYEKAISLDPAYAPAWAGLGIPLYNLANRAPTQAEVEAQRRRALGAADKAVQLSPDLPDALSTRGVLRAVIDHDWASAEADLKHALAVTPNDADSHRRYAILLEDLGRFPQAMKEIRTAIDLDPLGPSWTALGWLHQFQGEYGEAEAAFRRHLVVWPDNLASLLPLAKNLLLQDKPRDALAVFERCPDEADRLWGRAAVAHALGDRAGSQAALDALVSRYGHTGALAVAELHAWRGERDQAFEWLDRAIAQRDGGMSGLFRIDAFLRDLRGDPRYADVLRKLKLPVRYSVGDGAR